MKTKKLLILLTLRNWGTAKLKSMIQGFNLFLHWKWNLQSNFVSPFLISQDYSHGRISIPRMEGRLGFLLRGRSKGEKIFGSKARLDHHDGIEHYGIPTLRGRYLEIVLGPRHHLLLRLYHFHELRLLWHPLQRLPQHPIVLLHRERPQILHLLVPLHVRDLRLRPEHCPVRSAKQHARQHRHRQRHSRCPSQCRHRSILLRLLEPSRCS